MNIVLITSIIITPNTPLSYSNSRSKYTREERYEQTKNTIESIKKIPNKQTIMIECSDLSDEEETYFKTSVYIFINLYRLNNETLKSYIYSPFKALGEGTMTMYGLNYLYENNNVKSMIPNHSGSFKCFTKRILKFENMSLNIYGYDIHNNNDLRGYVKLNNKSMYKTPASIILSNNGELIIYDLGINNRTN